MEISAKSPQDSLYVEGIGITSGVRTTDMAARPPMKRWVHISEEGGDPWVLPIWSAANRSRRAGRSTKLTERMSELGVHVSTRLNLLPQVIRRINEGAASVNAEVSARPAGHEFYPRAQAYALRIDKTLKFRLLLDIDSLLFEMNSLYELWCEFFKALHVHAAKKNACQDGQ
jgi:hypothetical protein